MERDDIITTRESDRRTRQKRAEEPNAISTAQN
jgi:hypothetical protein